MYIQRPESQLNFPQWYRVSQPGAQMTQCRGVKGVEGAVKRRCTDAAFTRRLFEGGWP